MKYRRFQITAVAISLLGSLAALAPALLLQKWQTDGAPLSVRRILLLAAVIAVTKAMNICLILYRERFAKDYNKRNFSQLLESALQMDYDSICDLGPSNLLERISMSANSIYEYMTGAYLRILSSCLTMAVCIGLTASIHLGLALLLLILLPVNYFGYRLLNRELALRSQELQTQTSLGFQEILSRIAQVDHIKQSPSYSPLLRDIDSAEERMYGSMARINEYAQSASAGLSGLNEIAQAIVVMAAVYQFLHASSGVYTMILTTMILPLYFSALRTVVNANLDRHSFETARAFQQELFRCREPDGTQSLSAIQEIELSVTGLNIRKNRIPFHADGTLKKGDVAQICGASGCGKSTFVKTLLKFRPAEGIKLNGRSLETYKNAEVRRRIEYLSQNVPIIKGTLRENLFLNTIYSKEAEQRFHAMPILAGIWKNKTMDSMILEGGANLSGGEKQKIALARALAQEADVLILDEVCSNIDREAAEEIYACLAAEQEKRITLLISHDGLSAGLANVKLNT